jgi:hypothetical protein
MRLVWRSRGPVDRRELNLGVVVAVLLASLVLQLSDRHSQP